MNNLISQIMTTNSPVLVVILSIALVYLFIKAIYDAGNWIIARLNGYYKIKNNAETKEEQIDKRITRLQQHDKWQYDKLNELSGQIKTVITIVEKIQQSQTQLIKQKYKTSIFKIYKQSTQKKYITQNDLARFVDLVKQYQEIGGNGVVDEKIYPEIMDLPIKTVDQL